MHRRTFLNKIMALGLIPFLGKMNEVLAAKNSDGLTILHTNDVHSMLEPFVKGSGAYEGLGGSEQRFAKIKALRATNKNLLLLDSGDFFQGTPYFNLFKGEAEIKIMNTMGYNAATFGNHDFDEGIDNLAKQLKLAKFPIVNCNYSFENTPLESIIKPYHIIKMGNIKVGITGVCIDFEGLVPKKLCGEIVYNNPIDCLNNVAAELVTKHKCNLVICLSHLGYKYENNKIDDLKLAEQSKNVHLILGGHTHTLLEKPTIVNNLIGKNVLINQVGWGGAYLGQLNYTILNENKIVLNTNKNIAIV